MAQDLRRWLLAVGLGCAALAVAYLPPPVREPREPQVIVSPERSLEERLRTALGNARRRAERAEQTERLVRIARTAGRGPGGSVRVIFEGGFTLDAQRTLRARVDSIWNAVVPSNPQVSPLLIVDGTSAYGAYMIPPGADAGATCRAMVSSRSTDADSYHVRPERLATVLAPCAYYATFGLPGPEVERWLRRRSYSVAGSVNWSGTLRDADLVSLSARPLYERLLVNMFYATFVNDNIPGLACAKGRLDHCQDGIPGLSPPARIYPGGLHTIGFANDYLASMVNQMGHERFARFWRSAQPVEGAFEDAFGVSLRSWTSQLNRSWRPVLPRDTAPRGAEWMVGILTIAAAAAGAAALAGRRQVT